jgi:hypothetical protein
MTGQAKKRLSVIMLVDEKLLPKGNLEDHSEKQRELRKTEFDVKEALERPLPAPVNGELHEQGNCTPEKSSP